MTGSQLEELAILNGMLLTDQVRAGSLIKTLGTLGGGAAVPSNSGASNSNNQPNNNSNSNTGSSNSDDGLKNNKTGTAGTKTTQTGDTKIGGKGKLKKKKD